jgi:cellulose synthase/poly-beta-1,6-N-acetylglucosamine synthase-like glycosyltransferase
MTREGAAAAQPDGATIAVLICTYRRPADLLRCLAALGRQSRPADEILIVARPEDEATRDAVSGAAIATAGLPIRLVPVTRPGLIAARGAGLDACRCDCIAMTDDDTAPREDWLARIVAHFEQDAQVGGVGGRDRCPLGDGWNEGRKAGVGTLSWFGRMAGYHHLGYGAARPVRILKGANMSYRMAAVGATRVDVRLRGAGAQPHEDAAFSMSIRRKGWRLIYDPAVLVDHYEGVREEARHYSGIAPVTDPEAFKEGAYNWAINLWDEFSPLQHAAFLTWNVLVGTRIAPGLVQALRFTPSLGRASWYRFWLTQQATWEAYRDLLLSRGPQPAADPDREHANASSETRSRTS